VLDTSLAPDIMAEHISNDRGMNRRAFLPDAAALGASAGWLATLAQNAGTATFSDHDAPLARQKPTVDGIGLQLYTVGDQMRTDFDDTIEKVARVVFKQVEFAEGPRRAGRVRASRRT
jgi:hypothetical protein